MNMVETSISSAGGGCFAGLTKSIPGLWKRGVGTNVPSGRIIAAMGVPASCDPDGEMKTAAGAGVNGEASASFLLGVLGVTDGGSSSLGITAAFLDVPCFRLEFDSRGAVVIFGWGAKTGAWPIKAAQGLPTGCPGIIMAGLNHTGG